MIHFWTENEFTGWYVNFETPGRWDRTNIESRDWHLDLWIGADLKAAWKDEEESEVAARFGHVYEEELAIARKAGEAILEDVGGWLRDLGDWRNFEPEPHWRALSLPAMWSDSPEVATDHRRGRNGLAARRQLP